MGDDSKTLHDDKNLWPEDLKKREEQWQKNGGSPASSKRHFDRKPPSPPMPPPGEGKARSRSRSREPRRRSRSRSRGFSPEYRRRQENYDYRRRAIRRSSERRPPPRRERNRSRNRSRSRDRRDRSLSRGRNRRDWSPKGRRSPMRRPSTPQAPPPPNINAPPPYIPQPIYSDGYNYPSGVPYGQNMPPQQFGGYDFPGQGPPQPYVPPYPPPPPVLMPPGASGDDFGSNVWGLPPPMSQPSMAPQMSTRVESQADKSKREAAVVQEMQNQRATLKKQREDYQRRASALTRELKILKEQRNKLAAVNQPHSPTTRNFLKENDRLQSQIQNKLSTIENVIDMLSGIIGVEKTPSPPPLSVPKASTTKARDPESDESESEKLKSKLIQSMKKNRKEKSSEANVSRDKLVDPERKVNYVFYDPEMHWCPMCNVFPKSAKDYLNHLHSKEHISTTKNQESPWHEKQQIDEFPNFPNAATKRTPIRGLQFFTASPAWYCKLCSIWMGDLHCASTHLKSKSHAENYNAYTEQNPHFDVDWMADRQKAYDIYREKLSPGKKSPLTHVIPLQPEDELDKKARKKKKKVDVKKEKKKKSRKKRRRQSTSSSSSSSSSDTESDSDNKDTSLEATLDGAPGNSIRVSMRNMTKSLTALPEDDTAVGKWTMVQPAQVSSHTPFAPPAPSISTEAKKRDELIISQWTPGPVISDCERKLLDDLKGKLKKRSEAEVIVDERRRSRERSPDRRRRRSRSRGRYSRSHSRSRSPYYRGYGRRRSSSRGRRSSSRGRRSNSRGRRVIEKPVVNYPPEPKRIEKKTKGKHEGNGERKKSPPKRKPPTAPKGKLPFIGRMPVFKKQVAAEDAAKQKEAEGAEETPTQPPVAAKTPAQVPGVSQGSMDDELMPDPTQFMVLLGGGAPPPPPMRMEKSEEVLPPGIDEAEADLVPKPISDAPRPRKGPLPKDFQDALDLIFPDEKRREVAPQPATDSNREPVDMEGVTAGDSIPEPGRSEEANQPIGMYGAYATTFPASGYAVYEGLSGAMDSPVVPPPPPLDMDTSADSSIPHVEMTIEESKEDSANKIELDDLALLGIDADDMAAQCM